MTLSRLTRRLTAVAMATPLLVALPARAQDFGALRAADTDGDGAISAEEARVWSQARFARMDRDGDGQLSQAEFVDARLALLVLLDSDGDGSVSRVEMRDHLRAARRQADSE